MLGDPTWQKHRQQPLGVGWDPTKMPGNMHVTRGHGVLEETHTFLGLIFPICKMGQSCPTTTTHTHIQSALRIHVLRV